MPADPKWRDEEIFFVKEYPTALGGKKPVRIYRSRTGEQWRWFLGFPEEAVKPLCPLLETTPYWGEQHCGEHDGFWLWWTTTVTTDDAVPVQKLNGHLKWMTRAATTCLDLCAKWAGVENPEDLTR